MFKKGSFRKEKKLIMTIEDKIRDEKLRDDINREAANYHYYLVK